MIQDFSKFKRFFAFGCSFTQYNWPTWADILSKEMDGIFYNLGMRGSGNLAISCRIAEANTRYKFCETDLIIVMFSTFCREDRYVEGRWRGHGNIYNQEYYPQDFVKKFADPDFYTIRDLALIELITNYLRSLDCKSVFLSSSSLRSLQDLINTVVNHDVSNQCNSIYNDLIEAMPSITLQDLIQASDPHGSFTYKIQGKERVDGHPNPKTAYEYLRQLDFPLTDKSKNYADQCYEMLLPCRDQDDIHKTFPEIQFDRKYDCF